MFGASDISCKFALRAPQRKSFCSRVSPAIVDAALKQFDTPVDTVLEHAALVERRLAAGSRT